MPGEFIWVLTLIPNSKKISQVKKSNGATCELVGLLIDGDIRNTAGANGQEILELQSHVVHPGKWSVRAIHDLNVKDLMLKRHIDQNPMRVNCTAE